MHRRKNTIQAIKERAAKAEAELLTIATHFDEAKEAKDIAPIFGLITQYKQAYPEQQRNIQKLNAASLLYYAKCKMFDESKLIFTELLKGPLDIAILAQILNAIPVFGYQGNSTFFTEFLKELAKLVKKIHPKPTRSELESIQESLCQDVVEFSKCRPSEEFLAAYSDLLLALDHSHSPSNFIMLSSLSRFYPKLRRKLKNSEATLLGFVDVDPNQKGLFALKDSTIKTHFRGMLYEELACFYEQHPMADPTGHKTIHYYEKAYAEGSLESAYRLAIFNREGFRSSEKDPLIARKKLEAIQEKYPPAKLYLAFLLIYQCPAFCEFKAEEKLKRARVLILNSLSSLKEFPPHFVAKAKYLLTVIRHLNKLGIDQPYPEKLVPYQGQSVFDDTDKAIIRQLTELADVLPAASAHLGDLYFYGIHTLKDLKKSIECYRKDNKSLSSRAKIILAYSQLAEEVVDPAQKMQYRLHALEEIEAAREFSQDEFQIRLSAFSPAAQNNLDAADEKNMSLREFPELYANVFAAENKLATQGILKDLEDTLAAPYSAETLPLLVRRITTYLSSMRKHMKLSASICQSLIAFIQGMLASPLNYDRELSARILSDLSKWPLSLANEFFRALVDALLGIKYMNQPANDSYYCNLLLKLASFGGIEKCQQAKEWLGGHVLRLLSSWGDEFNKLENLSLINLTRLWYALSVTEPCVQMAKKSTHAAHHFEAQLIHLFNKIQDVLEETNASVFDNKQDVSMFYYGYHYLIGRYPALQQAVLQPTTKTLFGDYEKVLKAEKRPSHTQVALFHQLLPTYPDIKLEEFKDSRLVDYLVRGVILQFHGYPHSYYTETGVFAGYSQADEMCRLTLVAKGHPLVIVTAHDIENRDPVKTIQNAIEAIKPEPSVSVASGDITLAENPAQFWAHNPLIASQGQVETCVKEMKMH